MEQNISLMVSYQKQVIDKLRLQAYQNELKFKLLLKMLEEKGFMAKEELAKRWPHHLQYDVGSITANGKMEGNLKVNFYN